MRPKPSGRRSRASPISTVWSRRSARRASRSSSSTEGEPRTLSSGADLTAFRVVQEALTNVMKHAGRANARVLLRWLDDALEIEVADDGRGPTATAPGGQGLIGMRERVALFDGTLTSGARPGGGFELRAAIPIGEASRHDHDPRPDRRRPGADARGLPDDPGRRAGHGGGGRGDRRGRCRPEFRAAAPRRRGDGRADAHDGRHRGHASDHRGRRRRQGSDAHDVRPRRVRLRRAARRRERVPVEGPSARGAGARGARGGGGRRPARPGGDQTAHRGVRTSAGSAGGTRPRSTN